MTDKPLVAIHNLVYNHEPYLRECFEGFVMQKTNFRFVVISHDDCSTDGSATIIREYAEKYPDIFRPIFETENQYSKRDGSLRRIMNEAIAATGAKYVAMCEGDDYWTDPLKLQKQVDFMEEHPNIGLCYTDYNHLDEYTKILTVSMFEKQHKYRPISYEQHLLKPGYLAPMTWLYSIGTLSFLNKSKVYTDGTYAYMLEFMQNSEVAYLPITTATYRSHAGSASAPIGNKALFRYIKGVRDTQFYYSEKYPCSDELKNKICLRAYLDILPIAIMAGDNEYVEQIRDYMQAHDLDIDLIIRELKQGKMRKHSYAYRLGKIILKPLSWIKQKNIGDNEK